MITYNWKIVQLERVSADGGVITAHWDCIGTDETGVSSRRYGSTAFSPDASSPTFIPYDSLTESIVLSWVWASDPEDSDFKNTVEASIASQIDKIKNPETVKGTPWN